MVRNNTLSRSPLRVYFAIGDPTRRRMLDMLRKSDRSVNELARPFRMSQPAISQHLRILRQADLVRARRHGRQRLYGLRAAALRPVFDWVAHYERFWTAKLHGLGDYLDREARRESRERS